MGIIPESNNEMDDDQDASYPEQQQQSIQQ
jgi:hypothetical protein